MSDQPLSRLPHAERLALSEAIDLPLTIRGPRWTDWRMLVEAAIGTAILAGLTVGALFITG